MTTLHAQVIAAAPFSVNIVDDVRSMLGLDFMRNAFIAGGAIAVAAGFVGYFVVLRNQVFSSDAIAHTAFTGGLAGLLAGAGLGAGMFGACIAVALGIEAAGGRGRGRDVAIGIVFAAVLGTGVLLLSVFTETSSAASATAGVSVLFGSILGLDVAQTAVATAVAAAVCVAVVVLARPLLFVSLDPDVARARGLPTRAASAAFIVLVALTVVVAVQAIGALLVLALMVTPAAVAQRLSSRPWRALPLGAFVALVILWLGLALSYFIDAPASFFITSLAMASLVAANALAAARLRRARKIRPA